ncbi:MAG TPA: ankyrin repeat domain-containing protein [Pyrinomonadaceae bacterium]|nr:ankyrin repeat domain-containing protein [Pyrinomonadaceae bacterium]
MSYSLPLTNAVTSGDEQAVSALLANGADVNETTGGGQTALILAVIFGRTNLVKILMKAGADPQLRDNLGLNAIEWAQRRGLTEALSILTNRPQQSTPPKRIVIPLEAPEPHSKPESKKAATETPAAPRGDENGKENVSEAEKSLRWVAGFKQRLHEQELRRLNRNEPPSILPEPPKAAVIETPKAPEPEPEPVPEPAPAPAPAPAPVRSVTPPPRILTPPPTPAKSGTRKRCPQCNAIYNSDLVAYCAHHIVPLVDADEPIISEPPKSNPPLFWILLIVTLAGSIVAGSLITTYLYKSRQEATRIAAEQHRPVQKGLPELGGEIVGKALLLPEAECPVKGSQPVSGTVTVRVMVDKNGQVYWARGAGGDWLLRGCATEAAMKSTFVPEKLRGREAEGTITYTFKP